MKRDKPSRTKKSHKADAVPMLPTSQAGKLESIGSQPSGRDDGDRSGEYPTRASGAADNPVPDNFMSSELRDAVSQGKIDSKTRS